MSYHKRFNVMLKGPRYYSWGVTKEADREAHAHEDLATCQRLCIPRARTKGRLQASRQAWGSYHTIISGAIVCLCSFSFKKFIPALGLCGWEESLWKGSHLRQSKADTFHLSPSTHQQWGMRENGQGFHPVVVYSWGQEILEKKIIHCSRAPASSWRTLEINKHRFGL